MGSPSGGSGLLSVPSSQRNSLSAVLHRRWAFSLSPAYTWWRQELISSLRAPSEHHDKNLSKLLTGDSSASEGSFLLMMIASRCSSDFEESALWITLPQSPHYPYRSSQKELYLEDGHWSSKHCNLKF